MAAIPVGEVAFAGFGVIRRKPMAVLVWGLVLFLFGLTVFAMVTAAFGGVFAAMAQAGPESEPDIEGLLALQGGLILTQLAVTLLSIVVRVVLTCAVYRAVLEPGADRFAYLRLGKAELLVGLVLLCLSVLLFILYLVLLLVGVAVVGAAALASETLAWVLGGLVLIGCVGLMIWVALRLSMALPMTFAERRFRFFEAWELTRGHTLSLLLMVLLVSIVTVAVGLVVAGLVIALLAAAGVLDQATWSTLAEQDPAQWLGALAPVALLAGLLVGVVAGALQAISVAPWAAAYRALVPAADLQPAPGAV